MKLRRIMTWLVTSTMVAVAAAVLLLGPIEMSLAAIVAYLVYRVAKIGIIVLAINYFARKRSAGGTYAVMAS